MHFQETFIWYNSEVVGKILSWIFVEFPKRKTFCRFNEVELIQQQNDLQFLNSFLEHWIWPGRIEQEDRNNKLMDIINFCKNLKKYVSKHKKGEVY
jgi:hypothetical protein